MLPSNYDYIDTLVENYNRDKESCEEIHNKVNETPDHIINYVFETSRYGLMYKSEEMYKRIKKHYWREVYRRSNMDDIISSKERELIHKMLDDELPDFTRDNIEQTLIGWADQGRKKFCEKVALCFERLSGDHITNQPQGFTKKLIFKHLAEYTWFPKTFSMYSFRSYGLDVVHDLRTSIQTLFKIPLSSRHDTDLILKTINERNEYTSFDNGAFKVKVFKNGNSHIELHPHVAVALNSVLAEAFPNAIPPKHRTKTVEIKEYTFEYRHLSERIKTELREFIMYGHTSKDPETGGTIHSFDGLRSKRHYVHDYTKEILQFLDIKEVVEHNLYKSNYDMIEIIRHVIVNGMVDYKSNQFYPTPENIVRDTMEVIVDDLIRSEKDISNLRILEPSAGRGAFADEFNDIHCIEKEELNTVFLKHRHKNVVCGDFLFYNVKKESERYDIIVMNPPYNNKQWKTHVNHAKTLLKQDGVIYAILPTGKKDEFENCELVMTHNNEFENTTISTSLYKIWR